MRNLPGKLEGAPLPKYRLTLLGRFELSWTDGPVELPNKKLAALLAYLACTAPEPQSRQKLATLLWGSHLETQARQNLRQALFRLRRALGEDALVSDGEEISLAPGVVDCDVTRLEALIRERSRASLAAAVDLYKGRFLSDVNISEEAWADWVGGERTRLEGSALDALVRLGEIELAAGRADKALETAHRALAQPPSRSPPEKEIAKPALPQTDQPAIAVLPIPEHVSSEGRLKVLIIDDHALIREALHTVLKQLKRETVIFEASNSRQAIHIVEEHPDLSLILLDVNLPDRDGFSVLGELRERHATIAIIILSALDDQDQVKRAFSLGALGFIRNARSCSTPFGWCSPAAFAFPRKFWTARNEPHRGSDGSGKMGWELSPRSES